MIGTTCKNFAIYGFKEIFFQPTQHQAFRTNLENGFNYNKENRDLDQNYE